MVIQFYYHPQSPPSAGVRMLLRELGVEHEEKLIDFWKEEHKSEEYKKVNPHMQVPTIKDGDLILTESRAIAMYLCNKYEARSKKEKLYPTDPVQVAKINSLLFRDIDNYKTAFKYSNVEAVLTGKACGPDESVLPKVQNVLAEYEALVTDQDFMFGNHLTILDFFVAGTIIEVALTGFGGWDAYPNLKNWKANLAKKSYFDEIAKKPTETSKQMFKDACEKVAAAKEGK